LLDLPATISFAKNEKQHDQLMTYQKQISHFSNDTAFKRVFSGFGPDSKNHHGQHELKFKPPALMTKQALSSMVSNFAILENKDTLERTQNERKTPLPRLDLIEKIIDKKSALGRFGKRKNTYDDQLYCAFTDATTVNSRRNSSTIMRDTSST